MHNVKKSIQKTIGGIIMRKLRLVKWDAFSCGRGRGQGGESGFGMSGDCKCPVQSKR